MFPLFFLMLRINRKISTTEADKHHIIENSGYNKITCPHQIVITTYKKTPGSKVLHSATVSVCWQQGDWGSVNLFMHLSSPA